LALETALLLENHTLVQYIEQPDWLLLANIGIGLNKIGTTSSRQMNHHLSLVKILDKFGYGANLTKNI